jgi:hypothetical protein
MYRRNERSGAGHGVVANARNDHARILESLRAAGLQDVIDCLAPDDSDMASLWSPDHPRWSELLSQAASTIKQYVSQMGIWMAYSDEERDGNYEVSEEGVIQHLEHVLNTQPSKEPKAYCKKRVEALQHLLVMQQGALSSAEDLPKLPELYAKGGRVHRWIRTVARNALWQARSR